MIDILESSSLQSGSFLHIHYASDEHYEHTPNTHDRTVVVCICVYACVHVHIYPTGPAGLRVIAAVGGIYVDG